MTAGCAGDLTCLISRVVRSCWRVRVTGFTVPASSKTGLPVCAVHSWARRALIPTGDRSGKEGLCQKACAWLSLTDRRRYCLRALWWIRGHRMSLFRRRCPLGAAACSGRGRPCARSPARSPPSPLASPPVSPPALTTGCPRRQWWWSVPPWGRGRVFCWSNASSSVAGAGAVVAACCVLAGRGQELRQLRHGKQSNPCRWCAALPCSLSLRMEEVVVNRWPEPSKGPP